jgi:hypothetical protein
MRRPSRVDVYAYVSGGLDPGRARDVEDAVAADPVLQAELLLARAELSMPISDEPVWRIPPPGIASGRRPVHVEVGAAAVMGEALRPGDRFEVAISEAAQADSVVVVLRRSAGTWSVVYPEVEDEPVAVEALPVRDGRPTLELVAGSEEGEQRWAVAFVPTPVEDWRAEGWRRLREALESGEVPVVALAVVVG